MTMRVEWEDIERAASGMFNIWTSGGDLAFARECWEHLAQAGLTDDDGVLIRTETCLRLVAIRLFYGGFCAAKWEEVTETEIRYLVEDLALDDVAVGLLAAPRIEGAGIPFDDKGSLRDAALAAAVDAVRSEVIECLRRAYGDTTGLYLRMSRTASNDDENDPSDLEAYADNLAGFHFTDEGR